MHDESNDARCSSSSSYCCWLSGLCTSVCYSLLVRCCCCCRCCSPRCQSMEKISLNLSNMKFMLYGDAENEPKEGDMNKLVEEVRDPHDGSAAQRTRGARGAGRGGSNPDSLAPLIVPLPSPRLGSIYVCVLDLPHQLAPRSHRYEAVRVRGAERRGASQSTLAHSHTLITSRRAHVTPTQWSDCSGTIFRTRATSSETREPDTPLQPMATDADVRRGIRTFETSTARSVPLVACHPRC